MQIPIKHPTDPTIANANRPPERALDDLRGRDGGGGGDPGGREWGGSEGGGRQLGKQMLSAPEQSEPERAKMPQSEHEDWTQGPGRSVGRGRSSRLGHPGPQQTMDKFLVVSPQVKFKPATIETMETAGEAAFGEANQYSPPPPQQTTEPDGCRMAQLWFSPAAIPAYSHGEPAGAFNCPYPSLPLHITNPETFTPHAWDPPTTTLFMGAFPNWLSISAPIELLPQHRTLHEFLRIPHENPSPDEMEWNRRSAMDGSTPPPPRQHFTAPVTFSMPHTWSSPRAMSPKRSVWLL